MNFILLKARADMGKKKCMSRCMVVLNTPKTHFLVGPHLHFFIDFVGPEMLECWMVVRLLFWMLSIQPCKLRV